MNNGNRFVFAIQLSATIRLRVIRVHQYLRIHRLLQVDRVLLRPSDTPRTLGSALRSYLALVMSIEEDLSCARTRRFEMG